MQHGSRMPSALATLMLDRPLTVVQTTVVYGNAEYLGSQVCGMYETFSFVGAQQRWQQGRRSWFGSRVD
ncbi:MAG: hypothetical protein RLZZ458_603 [Planctomycetota bacterium]|jgi:hypothetical protein